MTLPAAQQRVLDRMEGTLQASEPHLVSMFSIFTRLNADEPLGAEPLARPRPQRRLRGPQKCSRQGEPHPNASC